MLTKPEFVSRRVKVILSHSKDSEKLAQAIRNQRNGKPSKFKLSPETKKRIDEL